MSNDNNKSDVAQAADKVDPNALKDNLNNNDLSPEDLSKDEETSFIEEDVRTDK